MYRNRQGERVPQVVFRTRSQGQWKDVATDDIFKGRTVVVFALPGAYTPTCSSSHVPRYNELAGAFKAAGVDEIVCLSVNDGFVMSEWQRDQNAANITFLPDGNAEFTRAMGMLADKSDLGFGGRSWRYSMLVKDGVIERMFIEPDKPGDPFEVSDADTMYAAVAPGREAPESAFVFTRRGCPFCARAKQLLESRGIAYEEVELGGGITTSAVRAVSGRSTVPQVFIGGRHIGGAEDLERHLGVAPRKAA